MNKVILIGRLTRDPELRYTPQGTAVCQITIAVNRRGVQPGQQDVDFINVSIWSAQAENVAKYMTKGRQMAIEGRIQTRNYDDKDGKKVYVTEILASNISFLDSKGTGTSSNSFNNLPEPPMEDTPSNNMETVSVDKDPFEAFGDSIEISDNDLPF